MSHRKVHSHGSIPFSWEDKPGICKTPSSSSSFSSSSSTSHIVAPPATPSLEQMLKIPLPPCGSQAQSQAHYYPKRSISGKGLRWQEDPFLVAYKEISKSDIHQKKCKKGSVNLINNNGRKSKSILWCKSSNDVKDGNFVKLPRLPRDHTSRTLTLGQELKYEAWVSYM